MVFGLFKKKATPEEFGHAVFHLASDFLASDAGRSLGMRFENWDGSDGWSNFLTRKGMPMAAQKLHYRLFSHCAVQAVCTQFDAGTSKGITRGATVTAFSSAPDGYNFETTYATLEAAYRGQHKFDRRVEPLSNVDAHINFLPNQNVGVVNAKYLIESFLSCRTCRTVRLSSMISSRTVPRCAQRLERSAERWTTFSAHSNYNSSARSR